MNEHILPSSADAQYGAWVLVRRLLTEQGLRHWRKYVVAFALMAIAAGCTAASAYLIGTVINEAYISPQFPRHRPLGGVTVALFASKGHRHLRIQRGAVAHRQPHHRRQSARRFRQAAQ